MQEFFGDCMMSMFEENEVSIGIHLRIALSSIRDQMMQNIYTYDVRTMGQEIHMWGKLPDMSNALLRIVNVKYYVYCECTRISTGMTFDSGVINEVREQIMDLDYVVDVEVIKMFNYFKSKDVSVFKIRLESESDKYRMETFMKMRNLFAGKVAFKTHENYWNNIIKFICDRDLSMNHWHRFTGREVTERKIGIDSVREFILDADSDTIELCDVPRTLTLSTLAFDIETYCHKIYTFPKAIDIPDEVIIITATMNHSDGSVKNYAFVLNRYGGEDIDDTEIREYSDEGDLLEAFQDFIIEADPDIITGFNIYGFDLPYIQQRLQNMGKTWKNIGRLKVEGIESVHRDRVMPWEKNDDEGHDKNANKYKNRSKSNVDNVNLLIPGRLVIDIFPRIKATFPNLKRYNLDSVAGEFLGEYKLDVSFEQLNMAYRDYHDDTVDYDPHHVYDEAIKYGIQDAVLTYRLFERLNIFVDISMYSHVTTTTIPDLMFKGSSAPVFASMYREFKRSNYLFMSRRPLKEQYQGGYVHEPIAGFYDQVTTLDINSLYPNVMITYNICPTTFVTDESVDDDLCHILEFEDHGQQYRYRFRKDKEGIVPRICSDLIARRKEVRSRKTDDPFQETLNDKLQLAIKILVNTVYGAYGIKSHQFSFLEGARAVTAMGRQLITDIMRETKSRFGVKIIYGDTDSVMFQPGSPMTYREAYEQSVNIMEYLNDWLPGTIVLELEKIGLFLLMKKKKYKYRHWDHRTGDFEVDSEGRSVYHTKGAESVRRDRCSFRSRFYDAITDWIMENQTSEFIDDRIFEYIMSFMRRYNEFIDDRLKPDDLYINIAVNDGTKNLNYPATIMLNRLKSERYNINSGERVDVIFVKNDMTAVGNKMYTSKEYEESHEGISQRDPLTPDLFFYVSERFTKSINELVQITFVEDQSLSSTLYRTVSENIPEDILSNEDQIVEYYEGLIEVASSPLMDVIDEVLAEVLKELQCDILDDQNSYIKRFEKVLEVVSDIMWTYVEAEDEYLEDYVGLNNRIMDVTYDVFSANTSERDLDIIYRSLKSQYRMIAEDISMKYTETLRKELIHVKTIGREIKRWGVKKCILIERVWNDLDSQIRNLAGLFSRSNFDHKTSFERLRHLRGRALKKSRHIDQAEVKIFQKFKHRFDYLINSDITWLGTQKNPMTYIGNLLKTHRSIMDSIEMGVVEAH